VILGLALEPVARSQTRKLLNGLEGARGDFSEVYVTLFPLRYRITHLKIREQHPKTKEPVLYAEELAVKLHWGRLLTGRVVGTVEGRGVKVVLHQPDEGVEVRLPPIEKVIPFRGELERAQFKQSEVLYIWVREKNRPSMWFHDIETTLENVGSRPGMVKGRMVLAARGKVQRSGTMTVFVTADPFATPLNFAGRANISDFDLAGMNSLLADTKGVKVTPSRFDMEMTFECRRGRLHGWLDPHVSKADITAAEETLGGALKALLTKISMNIEEPAEGTKISGRIEVSDDLTDPKRQLWPSLEKVVENGLLLGVQESIKRKLGGPGKKYVPPERQKPTELKTGG